MFEIKFKYDQNMLREMVRDFNIKEIKQIAKKFYRNLSVYGMSDLLNLEIQLTPHTETWAWGQLFIRTHLIALWTIIWTL